MEQDYSSIPRELARFKQWSYSFSDAELKRPKHTHYTPNGSLGLMEAWENCGVDKYLGFYTTLEDPYILGDVDHVADPEDLSKLPLGLVDILRNHGAYCETSPSGQGIRFVLRLAEGEDKGVLTGNTFYTNEKLPDKREAQINVGPPWMTITGNPTSYSSAIIGTVTLDDLESAFHLKRKDAEIQRRCDVTPDQLPKMKEVSTALFDITLDQNPRIQRAYKSIFKETYSHYTFWLKVLMAMHDYGTKAGREMECLEEVIKWSATDTESFEGESDIVQKWESFAGKETEVGYRTLFGLAYANHIKWPRPKPLSKAQRAAGKYSPDPLNTEFSNFSALLNFYNITVYRDVHSPVKFYITSDEDIAIQYFEALGVHKYLEKYYGVFSEKMLVAAFHILCQDVGFIGATHGQVLQFIRNAIFQVKRELDVVREYFNTPFEDLPASYQENSDYYDESTVDYMFSALEIDCASNDHDKEKDLYHTYYRSWLMGLVRGLFYKDSFHMNNCILLLTGREQIRKTSHFRFMLPKFMRKEYLAFTTHGFNSEGSMRDVVKLSSENLMIVWDEIEQFLTRDTESNFKKVIDNTPQKFIDKYEVMATEVRPVAIYGGTSNQREFQLSDNGSRRIFHIPVSWVDTDKLDRICWHKLVNDLRKEIAEAPTDDPPWLLTRRQLGYQAMLHQKISNKTGMEFVLNELFNWDTPNVIAHGKLPRGEVDPRKSCYCMTFAAIKRLVAPQIGRMPNQTEQIALKKTVMKLCSVWTDTVRKPKVLSRPSTVVKVGSFKYNNITYFITPIRRETE